MSEELSLDEALAEIQATARKGRERISDWRESVMSQTANVPEKIYDHAVDAAYKDRYQSILHQAFELIQQDLENPLSPSADDALENLADYFAYYLTGDSNINAARAARRLVQQHTPEQLSNLFRQAVSDGPDTLPAVRFCRSMIWPQRYPGAIAREEIAKHYLNEADPLIPHLQHTVETAYQEIGIPTPESHRLYHTINGALETPGPTGESVRHLIMTVQHTSPDGLRDLLAGDWGNLSPSARTLCQSLGSELGTPAATLEAARSYLNAEMGVSDSLAR